MRSDFSPRLVYGAIAVLLVAAGAIGYMVWRDSQTSSLEFSIGDGHVEITGS